MDAVSSVRQALSAWYDSLSRGEVVSLITLVALVVGLLVQAARMRIMKLQINDARSLQQYHATITWMEKGVKEVEHIIELGRKNKPFEQWEGPDKEIAAAVCYRFHMLGIMIRRKMMSDKDICLTWYYSIQECWLVLQGYIADQRKTRHPLYYSGIDYLAERTAKLAKKFKGYQSRRFKADRVREQICINLRKSNPLPAPSANAPAQSSSSNPTPAANPPKSQ